MGLIWLKGHPRDKLDARRYIAPTRSPSSIHSNAQSATTPRMGIVLSTVYHLLCIYYSPRPPLRTRTMFSTEHSNALQSHFEASEMAEEKGMKVISIITESLKSRPPSEFEAETRTTTPTAVQSPPTKYGWRFYGSFVCLCVINLVCAIDASILSVALPVSPSSFLSRNPHHGSTVADHRFDRHRPSQPPSPAPP